MKDLVEESISVLTSGQDILAFGKLLHEGWQAKRSLSPNISNSYVEEIYHDAMSAGAIGGKLMGAGGGGFMLLFVPPSNHSRVREKLSGLLYVPFKFEFSGSQIIFFDREEDYAAEERARINQPIRSYRELSEPQDKEEKI
jgi:D-glycero-alpha-D-manno-heptose-7-phosphate kinase